MTDSSGRSPTAPGPGSVTTCLGRSLPTFGVRGTPLSTIVGNPDGHQFSVEQVHMDLAFNLPEGTWCFKNAFLEAGLLRIQEVSLVWACLLSLGAEPSAR